MDGILPNDPQAVKEIGRVNFKIGYAISKNHIIPYD